MDQQVYVNGRKVTPATVDGALVVELALANLAESNSLTYVLSTPEGGVERLVKNSADTSRWGLLRAATGAGPWQRQVFNGWAQVIVQSTGKPGQASLRATSDKVAPSTIRFEAR